MSSQWEERIVRRGRELMAGIRQQTPTVFDKSFWTGKVLDWAMHHEDFKVQLLRFVDVLPSLTSGESLQRHLEEYFGQEGGEVPPVLKWGAGQAGRLGQVGGRVLGKVIRSNLEGLARQFVVGHTTAEALRRLGRLRQEGFAFTVDLLGEATVSEDEADTYQQGYLELSKALAREQVRWPGLGGGKLDWGHAPKVNLSLKPSALYSQAKPAAPEDSTQGILRRLEPIYREVVSLGGGLCLDMEQHRYKDIILEVYRRLRSHPEFRSHPHLWVVIQAYLKDSEQDLEALLAWARKEDLHLGIRLVKGAYWEYENTVALQSGWPSPVWEHKAQSDLNFERLARRILENHQTCNLACASHNVRSLAAVWEMAQALEVPPERYEFQLLYGMAEPVRRALLDQGGRVRLYCPYGELLPGMAYLVRRILENTSNESFLRQSFVEGAELEDLLEDPRSAHQRHLDCSPITQPPPAPVFGGLGPFVNQPLIDFTQPGLLGDYQEAIRRVRGRLGATYPLVIGGRKITTADTQASHNPADPGEVVGLVCQAGPEQVDKALAAAAQALPAWRGTPASQRIAYLQKAAQIARQRLLELAAWQVLEVGKQLDQAYHDVAEAIDFLEYYARQMQRLATPQRLGHEPGELNLYHYQPRGLAAVIAPWNFPLAISCGMAAAALVAGNCVVYKPSSLAAVVGFGLHEVFEQAGLPPGVFNYCPGRGSVMGDYLVEHPLISLIAFTGSSEVGLRIQEKAVRLSAGQAQNKRVIAELGGKNAIIIDDDADLDEAVPAVLASAFGYQGQKCSACSRVIVLEAVYGRFIERLLAAARSLDIGPAEDPRNYLGPVVDAAQQKKVLEYITLAGQEGRIIFQGAVPERGCYAPPTIVEGITPLHRLAQEEVFGPLLAVMQAKDFDQALAMANSTRQALTGGVFSRSPRHLEQARRQFRVGNLYLNRGITGALVARQPFGGFGISGLGFKAGGPDYLLQFMDARCVTENTMRRGFAPVGRDDQWVC
ncbi:MAG: bifunctional proline dehydrogenase/L-glutamate gamma-semialdehyde dehydrogenase [Desulfarculus sp.]|nr:bifunctional proline dehydrogenase/L-glutamate gamma-semialdehyde dehydrogenase [Desulfarculus sp.]